MTAPCPDRADVAGRPTWAEVSLPRLRENFQKIRSRVGEGVTVCAVVKADAYGHGAVECARALEAAGATWLGVTNAQEGVLLRQAGIKPRILLMTGIWHGEEAAVIAHNLTPVVWERWQIHLLENAAHKQGKLLPVHLKIDTGMTRLGAQHKALPAICEALASCQHLQLEGASTHLASSEMLDAEDAPRQLACFEECLQVLHAYGFWPPLIHVANSAAIAARRETWKTMVRPGISLYGYELPITQAEATSHSAPLDVKPILSWKTRVIAVKEVSAGQAVGYCGTHTMSEPGRIAVLPVGYADGFHRALSNRGRIIVRGDYAPVVGRVSMDLITVDVTHVPGAEAGDEVVLIGESGDKRIDAWEQAHICDTIPYEILCNIAKRVPRVYVSAP